MRVEFLHAIVMLHQSELFHFSTDGLPQYDRYKVVLELRERGILPIEPLPDRTVHVDITKWFLPGLGILSGIFRVKTTLAGKVHLCGLRQEGTTKTANDDLFYGIDVAGNSAVVQRGREITPEKGDAFLLNVAAGAFAISRPRSAHLHPIRSLAASRTRLSHVARSLVGRIECRSIAYDVSFGDLSYFNRTFRRLTTERLRKSRTAKG